jgi:hypothetical protein
MGMNRRWNELKRRKPLIAQNRRILIVCEGEITEPKYFRYLGTQVRANLEVKVVGPVGVPWTVVSEAVRLNKEARHLAKKENDRFLLYDEIWCVFDRDDHPRVPESIARAKTNGFFVALSNPCFELWILLHFQSQNAHILRGPLKALCKQHIPNYEKDPPCETLYGRKEGALKRAAALEKWQRDADRYYENPSTGVHKLVNRIDDLAALSVIAQLKRL